MVDHLAVLPIRSFAAWSAGKIRQREPVDQSFVDGNLNVDCAFRGRRSCYSRKLHFQVAPIFVEWNSIQQQPLAHSALRVTRPVRGGSQRATESGGANPKRLSECANDFPPGLAVRGLRKGDARRTAGDGYEAVSRPADLVYDPN